MLTKDTKVKDWLEWFVCDSAPAPFLLPGGRRAATDRVHLVATNLPGPAEPIPQGSAITPQVAEDLLSLVNYRFLASLAYAWLKKEAGAAILNEKRTCRTCDGKGKVDHSCECKLCRAKTEKCHNCDGEGRFDDKPKIRPAHLFGNQIDLNRLAYVLAFVPIEDTINLYLSLPDNATPRILMVTTSWTAVFCVSQAEGEFREICPARQEPRLDLETPLVTMTRNARSVDL